MQSRDVSKRISQLTEQSLHLLNTAGRESYEVDSVHFAKQRASVLSFITMVYGEKHSYYAEFKRATEVNRVSGAQQAHGVLLAIKEELEGDWLFSARQLLAAEIFSDFIEMANYLLQNGYKDAATVMVGGVLEEHLRQMCIQKGIEIHIEMDGAMQPKKADRLNADLAKNAAYGKLDQKSVTMWLDIRNKAAHGKYDEFTGEQANLMVQGVTDFLTRTSA